MHIVCTISYADVVTSIGVFKTYWVVQCIGTLTYDGNSPCRVVGVGFAAGVAFGVGVAAAARPRVGVAAGAGAGAGVACLTKHSLPPDSPSVADPRGGLACLTQSGQRGRRLQECKTVIVRTRGVANRVRSLTGIALG